MLFLTVGPPAVVQPGPVVMVVRVPSAMLDDQQGDHARPAGGDACADVAVAPHAERQRIVPTVAEGEAEAVRSFGELCRSRRGCGTGCRWSKAVHGGSSTWSSSVLPLRLGRQKPSPATCRRARDDRLGKREFMPQQRRGIGLIEILVTGRKRFAIVDPARTLPVGGSLWRDFHHGGLCSIRMARPPAFQQRTFQ